MTTIAWDGRTLAADTQLTFGDTRSYCRKIILLPEKNWVWAAAGEAEAELKVLLYLKGERPEPDPKEMKKFEALIWDNEKKQMFFLEESPVLQPVINKIHAIGSGWQIAMAALHLGLPSRAAVETAGELNIYTNTLVDTYDTLTGTLTQCNLPSDTPPF